MAIIDSIHIATNKLTPLLRISPRSKPGFTPKCKDVQQYSKRIKRRWRKTTDEDNWEEYRKARNHKSNMIKRNARRAFRAFVHGSMRITSVYMEKD